MASRAPNANVKVGEVRERLQRERSVGGTQRRCQFRAVRAHKNVRGAEVDRQPITRKATTEDAVIDIAQAFRRVCIGG